MREPSRLLAMLALAACTLSGTGARAQRIGYVDMDKLFQGYYKTLTSDSAFQKQKQLYRQHAKDLVAEIEAIRQQRDQLQEDSLNIALSDAARNEKRQAAAEKDAIYQEKKKELKAFVQDKDKELGKKFLKLRADIVKELTEYIKGYAKEQKYDLILDTSGLSKNFIPVIIYYPTDQDLTETLLTRLNRGHEDEVAKAKEGKKKTGDTAAPLSPGG
ncbi:MAG: OmpH family outer membrane protein [Kiritimatiellaeota bacterium]|nr:OmpH family outer membrane protein [Kiritimatiellota bacterium]